MFAILNKNTGRKAKWAIDRKLILCDTKEEAQLKADGLNAFAIAGDKKDRYIVVNH